MLKLVLFSVVILYQQSIIRSQLTCPATDDDYDAEVLIFGGGITGITIARHLHDNGITNIKVLEARSDKIGGRILSADFGGAKIELGANWIHHVQELGADRSRHPLWKLAKETEGCNVLSGQITVGNNEFWDDLDGKYEKVSQDKVDDVQERYDTANGEAEELANQIRRNGNSDITVREALSQFNWNPNTAFENVTDWFNFDYSVAQPPELTSLLGFFSDDGNEFGNLDYFITDQRGFSTIVDCVAKGIESKIQLGAMVNNISWNDNCVCASVSVNSQDRVMCGKYGVVTFSIGVLQDWIKPNQQKFIPQLSTAKLNSINALGMGYYLKIFVLFNQTFWNTNFDNIFRTDAYRDYYPVISPVGHLYPGSPPMVIITLTGSEAIRVSNQNVEDTKAEIMNVIKQIYGNSTSNITDILIPSWINDPLYRGMYAYPRFGMIENDLFTIKQPSGKLYFSGDSLSFPYMGYIHGGYCEGLTTANGILNDTGRDVSTSSLPLCSSSSVIIAGSISTIIMFFMATLMLL
jgi:polyamine oxidase